jgi:hypothetical protein
MFFSSSPPFAVPNSIEKTTADIEYTPPEIGHTLLKKVINLFFTYKSRFLL